ncbi:MULTISPECIES: alginate lyase family protein [Niastella]|uniref:Alginate lyase family protein n=1 Tax=Niastella soli TaxID=2821487 RepID=A0ABS3YLV6_9BACT|nr:alginate lyase family protein [Niastella soli]MBO9198861.1 alginate lyase family protein [Niastella soli]
MKKIISILGSFLFFFAISSAQTPDVLLMDANKLATIKKKIQQQDAPTLQLLNELRKQADELLTIKLVSVTDKAFTPASGDKHDYMSQAPYFWYDSSKPNGLPYMRKDGVRNPEINKITDHRNLSELDNACRTLSLTWYLTGEEKYAAKTRALLHYWFLFDASKMNPNLNYAQAIPGITNGRGIGIIETIALTGIADAIGLLQSYKPFAETENKPIHQWYTAYLNWMLTSKNGNEEHAAKNNHGTWFYAQAIDFALFTGNKAKAIELVEESKKRLDSQIDATGKMQLELDRTNGLGYSTFNLQAWFRVATLAQYAGINLWQYVNQQGATLRTALDWLLPYALGQKAWTYQQIGEYNKNNIYSLLLQAAAVYKDPQYTKQASQVQSDKGVVEKLLYR